MTEVHDKSDYEAFCNEEEVTDSDPEYLASGAKSYRCEKCSRKFAQLYRLRQHQQRKTDCSLDRHHLPDDDEDSDNCRQRIRTRSDFKWDSGYDSNGRGVIRKIDELEGSDEEEWAIRCLLCEKMFQTSEELSKHVLEAHNDDEPSTNATEMPSSNRNESEEHPPPAEVKSIPQEDITDDIATMIDFEVPLAKYSPEPIKIPKQLMKAKMKAVREQMRRIGKHTMKENAAKLQLAAKSKPRSRVRSTFKEPRRIVTPKESEENRKRSSAFKSIYLTSLSKIMSDRRKREAKAKKCQNIEIQNKAIKSATENLRTENGNVDGSKPINVFVSCDYDNIHTGQNITLFPNEQAKISNENVENNNVQKEKIIAPKILNAPTLTTMKEVDCAKNKIFIPSKTSSVVPPSFNGNMKLPVRNPQTSFNGNMKLPVRNPQTINANPKKLPVAGGPDKLFNYNNINAILARMRAEHLINPHQKIDVSLLMAKLQGRHKVRHHKTKSKAVKVITPEDIVSRERQLGSKNIVGANNFTNNNLKIKTSLNCNVNQPANNLNNNNSNIAARGNEMLIKLLNAPERKTICIPSPAVRIQTTGMIPKTSVESNPLSSPKGIVYLTKQPITESTGKTMTNVAVNSQSALTQNFMKGNVTVTPIKSNILNNGILRVVRRVGTGGIKQQPTNIIQNNEIIEIPDDENVPSVTEKNDKFEVIEMNGNIRLYRCKECNQISPNMMQMVEHNKKHLTNSAKSIVLPTKVKPFEQPRANTTNNTNNIQTENYNFRPYKCMKCSQTFQNLMHMEAHKRSQVCYKPTKNLPLPTNVEPVEKPQTDGTINIMHTEDQKTSNHSTFVKNLITPVNVNPLEQPRTDPPQVLIRYKNKDYKIQAKNVSSLQTRPVLLNKRFIRMPSSKPITHSGVIKESGLSSVMQHTLKEDNQCSTQLKILPIEVCKDVPMMKDEKDEFETTTDMQRFERHICGYCEKPFTNIIHLEMHLALCRTYSYPIKGEGSPLYAKLFANIQEIKKVAQHMEMNGICFCCGDSFRVAHIGYIRCPHCPKSFRNFRSLDRHLIFIHATVKKFECNICNASCPSELFLELHKNSHKRGKPYACRICGMEFVNETQSCRHTLSAKIYARKRKNEFPCEKCGKTFIQSRLLGLHALVCRQQIECDCCEPTHLKKEPKIHNKKESYKCVMCLKIFPKKWILNSHLLSHVGESLHASDARGESLSLNIEDKAIENGSSIETGGKLLNGNARIICKQKSIRRGACYETSEVQIENFTTFHPASQSTSQILHHKYSEQTSMNVQSSTTFPNPNENEHEQIKRTKVESTGMLFVGNPSEIVKLENSSEADKINYVSCHENNANIRQNLVIDTVKNEPPQREICDSSQNEIEEDDPMGDSTIQVIEVEDDYDDVITEIVEEGAKNETMPVIDVNKEEINDTIQVIEVQDDYDDVITEIVEKEAKIETMPVIDVNNEQTNDTIQVIEVQDDYDDVITEIVEEEPKNETMPVIDVNREQTNDTIQVIEVEDDYDDVITEIVEEEAKNETIAVIDVNEEQNLDDTNNSELMHINSFSEEMNEVPVPDNTVEIIEEDGLFTENSMEEMEVISVDTDVTKTRTKTHDEVEKLLNAVIGESKLKDLGWPILSIEETLIEVIKHYGYTPIAQGAGYCLRENVRLFLSIFMGADTVKGLLKKSTLEDIIRLKIKISSLKIKLSVKKATEKTTCRTVQNISE